VPPGVVTLLVTPEQAARIALAGAQGQVMLTLRNPLDAEPGDIAGVKMAQLLPPPVEKVPAVAPAMATVRPKPAPKVDLPPPPPPPPPAYNVEAIRGGKRSQEEVIQ
jgi:Flp pilus assembly protein CpaB